MNNVKTAVPAGAENQEPQRVCFNAHLYRFPGFSKDQVGCCRLRTELGEARMLADMAAAPQFAQIRPQRLLEQARGRLGVILLTESDYYARQAALYLASISAVRRNAGKKEKDDFWEGIDLGELEEDNEPGPAVDSAMVVLSPAMLDPEMAASEREDRPGRAAGLKKEGQIELHKLKCPAALIAVPSGPVLTKRVLEEIESLDLLQEPPDVFVAVKKDQVDLDLLEELRFTYGFQVCRVGLPDRDYLRRVLKSSLEELLMGGERVDLDKVIDHTRSVRGSKFEETDLEKAVLWAIQRGTSGSSPATEDLLFKPLRLQEQAAAKLEEMVGLENVKETARRLTARAVLEARRRTAGRKVEPACRNLAFSGPPGTGKSVVARLLAQLLREAGVGTGRFVEAGREQLIGRYLGHTSPMIADLFREADGGVLFIDEAGALLGVEHDTYANEAVNALVRHMEKNPQTMVVFATYPKEMGELLNANPGLSSRIARVLDFPGYDDGQLWDILKLLAKEQEFTVPDEAREDCLAFFAALRARKGENFGNGREARRLFQTAVEELALREGDDLTPGDLKSAAERLLEQSGEKAERKIGF